MDGETKKSSCAIETVGATNGENKEGASRARLGSAQRGAAAAGRGSRSLKTLKRLRRRVSPGSDAKQLHNYRKTITPTLAER